MDMTIVSKKDAKIWMEEQEVCREYFKTDKITFGMSELPAGAGVRSHFGSKPLYGLLLMVQSSF